MRSKFSPDRSSPAVYYDMFYNGGKHEVECQTVSGESVIEPIIKTESILDICLKYKNKINSEIIRYFRKVINKLIIRNKNYNKCIKILRMFNK